MFTLAVGLIMASAQARVIGINRWLTASSVLAQAYATADAARRQMIELIQPAVNS